VAVNLSDVAASAVVVLPRGESLDRDVTLEDRLSGRPARLGGGGRERVVELAGNGAVVLSIGAVTAGDAGVEAPVAS
jgi:hypothetical protein